jgi:hypothetical protein
MGELHDALEAGGYTGHDLERFLVRILFCLFAEDTGIFERESFHLFIENRTAPDGSDLGQCLARLFEVLNTPPEKRQKNLDETSPPFPTSTATCSTNISALPISTATCATRCSPARARTGRASRPPFSARSFKPSWSRRNGGRLAAHYTSERDILKVIRSLFLDELRAEFEPASRPTARPDARAAGGISRQTCRLRFLDPACGCGNFLVITYRELRQLELEVLKLNFSASKPN